MTPTTERTADRIADRVAAIIRERPLDTDQIQQLAEVLGVPVARVLGLDDE